jgi:glycine/D-amino acid oxidase-like deaminating enzyme
VGVDVVVVGGGVCGLSAALHLASLGKRVVVLEREAVGAPTQASSINSGILENCSPPRFGLRSDLSPAALLAALDDEADSARKAAAVGLTPAAVAKNEAEGAAGLLEAVLCAGTLGLYASLEAAGTRHGGVEFRRQGMLQVLETPSQVAWAKAKRLPALTPAALAEAVRRRSAATARTPPSPVRLASAVVAATSSSSSSFSAAASGTAAAASPVALAAGELHAAGMLVSAEDLPLLEPGLSTTGNLLGAILFPDCGAAHPRKVVLMAVLRGN